MAFAFLLALEKVHESDSLWHLKTGEWILAHGAVPRADFFSSTLAGKSWLDWEWLFQSAMYVVYAMGGFNALVIAKAVLVALTAGLVLITCRDYGVAPLVTMLAFVVARDRLEVRPDVALLFFAAASVAILEAARAGNARWLVALPVVQLVWVNTHPSFPLGICIVGVYVLGDLVGRVTSRGAGDRPLRSAGLQPLVLFLAIAACLVNPYGLELLRHALTQTRGTGPAGVIGEWQPTRQLLLSEPNWSLRVFWWLFWLTPVALAGRLVIERGKFPWAHALVLAGMSVLALRANRFTAVYAIVAAPILASALSVFFKDRLRIVLASASIAVAGFLIWVVAANRWAMAENRAARFGVGLDEQTVPMRALAELKKLPAGSELFNTFLSGGPLIWDGWRAFADGRANLYGREFVDRYREAMRDPAKWDAWMRERNVSVVFLQYGTGDDAVLLQHLAQSDEWSMHYFDHAACIFTRGGSVWPDADALCQRARDAADAAARTDKYAWGRAVATMGNFLMVCGKTDAAARLFDDAIAVNPRVSEAWMNLGVIERNHGNFDRALELVDRLLVRNPYYYQARLMRAEIEAARGDVDAAVSEVEGVLKRAPHSAQAWFVRAQLAARQGDRAAAIAALRRVVAEQAEDQTVYWFLARLLAGDGRREEAIAAYENCLRVWVDAPEKRGQVESELQRLRGPGEPH